MACDVKFTDLMGNMLYNRCHFIERLDKQMEESEERSSIRLLLLFAMIRSVVKSFKVPGVEVVASRMSNEAALTRMIDSTPKKNLVILDAGPG